MIKTLKKSIWGRDFELPIEFDCYKGEEVTREQKRAMKAFDNHDEWIENAKKEVEDFCREAVMSDSENNKKDNIFSYVKPDYVFVKREDNPHVIMICKYRYDQEHGLAIVFDSDGSVVVGSQDII